MNRIIITNLFRRINDSPPAIEAEDAKPISPEFVCKDLHPLEKGV